MRLSAFLPLVVAAAGAPKVPVQIYGISF